MKRIFSSIFFYLILLFLFLSYFAHYQLFAEENFKGYVVCIDPGHQGKENKDLEPTGPGSSETKPSVSSGTRGKLAGPEDAVNLDVALRLHEILTKKGVTVVMVRVTPDVNVPNSERASIANRCKADLCIRLHCDAGAEHNCFTLYPALIKNWTDDIYDESFKAAGIVQKAYFTYIGIPDKGLIPRSDLSGFNWSDVPVILPEMLHLQNPEDDQKASTPEFRQKMAEGLAIGVLEYLKTVTHQKKNS